MNHDDKVDAFSRLATLIEDIKIERYGKPLRAALHLCNDLADELDAPASATSAQLPADNDGKEQDAFEKWAASEAYTMTTHPLHWLFLDKRTYAARDGWRAALRYVAQMARSEGRDA